MREIKFRGKTEEMNSWWTYGSLVICDNGDYQIGHCAGYGHTYFRNKVFENTVGQYTGLKDKNGKEIYEGDIIKVFASGWDLQARDIDEIGCVEYKVSEYGYNTKNGWYSLSDLLQNVGNDADIEIIGNIYDNKELLEEG